jgi:hypothetical protein
LLSDAKLRRGSKHPDVQAFIVPGAIPLGSMNPDKAMPNSKKTDMIEQSLFGKFTWRAACHR